MAKKLIMEKGFVLGREIKEATEEFTGKDGNVVPAQPKRFVVHLVTSSKCDEKDGMSYISRMSYKTDEKTYNSLTYLTKVLVTYEYSVLSTGNEIINPVAIEILK